MMVAKGVDHMNRSLLVILLAIFLILATSITLAAQGRAHFGGSRAFSSPPAGRSPSVAALPPVVAPFPRPPAAAPFAHGPVVAPSDNPVNGFRPFRPVRPVVVPPTFSYYSPYFWPGPYGGSAYYPYPAPAYSEPAYPYPDTQPPAVSQNEIDLAYQVGQLSQQVQQLQQQQAVSSYTQPSSPPQRAGQQESTPAVLLFRDGRSMEVRNYAIIGETLWVLDEKVATKIPLSDLDLDATQK